MQRPASADKKISGKDGARLQISGLALLLAGHPYRFILEVHYE
jgi:hypothetical protein